MPSLSQNAATSNALTHGVCDYSGTYNCLSGTYLDDEEDREYYKWKCLGLNGGRDTECKQFRPINGTCRICGINILCNDTASIGDGCFRGDFKDIENTPTHAKWQCLGLHGGSTQDCETRSFIPVCDYSGTLRCLNGAYKDRSDTRTQYRWRCFVDNSFNKENVNCEQSRLGNGGICNERVNTCFEGTRQDQPDTQTHYKWQCVGANGDVANCEIIRPGVCDYTQTVEACLSGTYINFEDSNTHQKWACTGNPSSKCEKRYPHSPNQTNGRCNNEVKDACHTGSSQDRTDSSTHYLWKCEGITGGLTSNCFKVKEVAGPVNGLCDNEVINTCITGTSQDQTDSSTHHLWQCVGPNGGLTQNCSQRKRQTSTSTATTSSTTTTSSSSSSSTTTQKIIGRCGNIKNSCAAGTFHGHPPDSNTHYLWTCRSIPHINPNREVGCSISKPQSPTPPPPQPQTTQKIIGRCSNTKNSCAAGTFHNHPPDTSTHYRWTCRSIPHTNPNREVGCSISKPPSPSPSPPPPPQPQTTQKIIGRCSNPKNSCAAGTFHNHPPDTITHYRWTCRSYSTHKS